MLVSPNHHYGLGCLRYTTEGGHKLIVEVDPGIVEVARALVPKAVRLNRQRWAPHITVIREERILPSAQAWGFYEGMEVRFVYDADVFNNNTYYWLRVFCPFLQLIRTELGLPETSEQSRPPDKEHCFHITIGNTKGG